jgi:rod shape-determining protein MreC
MREARRIRLVLALLVVTAIALTLLDYRAGQSSPFRHLRSLAGDIFGPVERGVSAAARPVGRWFAEIGHLGHYQGQLDALQRQNDRLREQLQLSTDTRRELSQFQTLFHMVGSTGYSIVPAQVTAVGDALGYQWTVTINRGENAGLRPNMTVVNGQGLVGRVRQVAASSAVVELAIDPSADIGARLEGSGELGYTTGDGPGPLTLTLLDAQATVHAGDRLLSLGSAGSAPYVPGVPIGVVTKVLATPGAPTRTAEVRPYVDYTALDLVGVVLPAYSKRHPARVLSGASGG